MWILNNVEVLCLLTILFVMLTAMCTGVFAMLWGCCALGSVGVIWFHEINRDIGDDEF